MGTPTPPAGRVVIGELGRSHGVAGELRAYGTGPTLDAIEVGDDLGATLRDGGRRRLVVRGRRTAGAFSLIAFDGVTSRDDALPLVGAILDISEHDLPAIEDPDEFYVRELIGFAVRTSPAGRELGQVVRVDSGAANDALAVRDAEGVEVLVPFTHDAIVALDRATRSMEVRQDLFGGDDA